MERLAFIVYIIVLMWSPVAFGAVYTYGNTVSTLGVLLGGLALLVHSIAKDRKSGVLFFRVPVTPLNLLLLLFFCLLLLQVTPLPGALVRLLSPEAWVVLQKSVPASEAVTGKSLAGTWIPLSPYSYPVFLSLIRWVSYGIFFLGFSQTLNTRKRIEAAVLAILILGCFEALYGLIQTYSGHHHIWWYKKPYLAHEVSGTYMNRNHFAGLMGMIMLLAAVYTAALAERKRHRERPQAPKSYFRARMAQWFSGEQRFNKRAFVLFFGVVTGIGLIFSASRGGIIAGAGGLLCISLLLLARQGQRAKGLIVFALFALISLYALAMGVDHPVERFESFDVSMEVRTRLTQRALALFRDYPLTGTGFGTFEQAYQKYQAPEDRKRLFHHAHNDWAELLTDGGILGVILFLAGISYYLYRTGRLWVRRRDPFAVCLGMAPFAAMAALGIHSWGDFNLHTPANFLMLTAVTAIGYSALHLENRNHRERSFYPYRLVPFRYRGAALATVLAGLILWCGARGMHHASVEISRAGLLSTSPPAGPVEAAHRILDTPPLNTQSAEYWFSLALSWIEARNVTFRNPDLPPDHLLAIQMKIIRALEEAARLNPLREEHHIRLGWEYARLWREEDARERWMPAADLSMERGAFFAGENNPYLHIMMGDYWLMRSKTVSPASPQWETFLARARWHYRKNLSLEMGSDRKRMEEHIRRNVWVHYPDEVFVARLTE